MKARRIRIDRERCNGCGACAAACHEGAIEMVEGKAFLTKEEHCDGLGDCLPACPTGAITIEEVGPGSTPSPTRIRTAATSQLMQWPCQIKLVPLRAPYFENADLLIAADCTAYAYGSIHRDFMHRRITLIGCPKLDEGDYAEKLTEILRCNPIRSITVLRMEVPCCGGMERAVKRAVAASGKDLPLQVVTLSTDGRILH